MKPLLLSVIICLSIGLFSQEEKSPFGSGGPNDYGYTWIDSDDPQGPDFSWIDIATSGTEIIGLIDDGVFGPFDIGFNFPFYGQTKSQFWINTNGCISFNDLLLPYANKPIPTGTGDSDFIAWFWDDLNPSDTNSNVYYEMIEDTMLVVQFKNYAQYLQQSGFINAEMILYESGKILVQYQNSGHDFELESETIGLQSKDSTTGLLVANNAPYVHDQLALLFKIDNSALVGLDKYISDNEEMTAYPNPVRSEVSFDFKTNENDLTFVIADLQGRIVHSVNVENNNSHLDLNLSNLSPGIYSATLNNQNNEKISGLKILVSR